MSRSGPKYWEITIFDSDNPKHRRVFSIIWYSLVVVLFCLAIYRVVMHPPIDYFELFEYTALFGIALFVSILISTGLWSKPLFSRSPLLLVLAVFLWCIILYRVVTHFPIDYFALFGNLGTFAYFLFISMKAWAREWNKPA
jgi:hypothetical protein